MYHKNKLLNENENLYITCTIYWGEGTERASSQYSGEHLHINMQYYAYFTSELYSGIHPLVYILINTLRGEGDLWLEGGKYLIFYQKMISPKLEVLKEYYL